MPKLFTKQNVPLICFISIEFILWLLIIMGSYIGIKNVIPIQYSSVCLVFIASIIFVRKLNLQHLIFFFIIIADLFLTLLRPQILEAGLAFFICATLTIFVYLYLKEKQSTRKIHIIIRVTLTIISLIGSIILTKNAVIVLSSVYGVNLILNVIYSFFSSKKNYLLSIGLICFMLCDIFVALAALRDMDMLAGSGPLFDLITGYVFNLAWLFYVPCLTLLSISLK